MIRKALPALVAVAITVVVWQATVVFTSLPAYMIPSPVQVATEFAEAPTRYAAAAGRTVVEALCGLASALIITTAIGLAFSLSSFIERHVSAYLVSLQSIPILAVAPLLTMWLGPGFSSKVAASMLVCFFPLVAAWSAGIRAVPTGERDLFRTMGASKAQTARWLIIPRVLPFFFAGLRVTAPLSILGAIVGEFVGATGGLGFLILSSSYYAQTAAMFVCIVLTALVGLLAHKLVVALEKRVVFWQGRDLADGNVH